MVASPAAADLRAEIDLSDQRLRVYVNGWLRHEWKISTARRGYRTPVGNYRPIRLERTWYSRKYDLAPMPYSVFFHGGYAIHGTTEIRSLGRPASHGCVRLHPNNAARLFELVQRHGKDDTRISVVP
ncbi:MAG TPA: L,D-transpeptidase [Hyphomicrobiales bacterium]|nr:L,D-transpeptidase [Hyphomicrobiales bacterium]